MKISKFLAFGLALLVVSASFSFANEDSKNSKKDGAKHPCAKIAKACKAAGFAKGEHKKGKGIAADCMRPLMEGKSVEGVSVDAETLTSCKAKKNDRQKMHKKHEK